MYQITDFGTAPPLRLQVNAQYLRRFTSWWRTSPCPPALVSRRDESLSGHKTGLSLRNSHDVRIQHASSLLSQPSDCWSWCATGVTSQPESKEKKKVLVFFLDIKSHSGSVSGRFQKTGSEVDAKGRERFSFVFVFLLVNKIIYWI